MENYGVIVEKCGAWDVIFTGTYDECQSVARNSDWNATVIKLY